MADHGVSCFAIAPEQRVMLGSRAVCASAGGPGGLIGGPETPSEITASFDLPRREAVDELVQRAGEAGGSTGDTADHPFTHRRQLDDPDGYHHAPFWMEHDSDATA